LERSERSHKWIYINWNLSALCLTHLGFRVCIELSENHRRNNPTTHDTTQFWLCSRFEAPRLNLGWARMESEQYKGQKLSKYGQITMNSNTSLRQHFWSKTWPLLCDRNATKARTERSSTNLDVFDPWGQISKIL
jgi:hypothetical protein